MNDTQRRAAITGALNRFGDGDLVENARYLFHILGYRSERALALQLNTTEEFVETYDPRGILNRDRALTAEWFSIDPLFQLRGNDLTLPDTAGWFFDPNQIQVDNTIIQSYVFLALRLHGSNYNRTQLSQITREINKLFPMPAMILFQHGRMLTLSIINRRLGIRDQSRDVLEKVTLIKDINFSYPHRAHIDILYDLSLKPLNQVHGIHNFVELHRAWEQTLDTEELNKKFYRELFNWFEWAVTEGKFPTNEERTLEPEEHVIRLITRLLFVWFIKEKGLVADELFKEEKISGLLEGYDRDTGDSYYRAVLQNLFFATLNTEAEKRGFSEGGNPDHRNFSLYRYKNQITDPDKLLVLFVQTPFINGGLFDCLDSEEAIRDGGYRIDCFSDVHYNRLSIPNRLFFDDDRGLIPLLEHYKFTVEENTPIEQDVALDPELLGRVFENLLAAYNPETGTTARQQTGSYYTPRSVVNYMVDEALVMTIAGTVSPTDSDTQFWTERLRYLFDYAKVFDDASEWFDSRESDEVVRAISELKILDPAVGSGAFPMGVLHKLTLALRRLDSNNRRWEQLQRNRAGKQAQAAFEISNQQERDIELAEISDIFERYRDSDFGRKLYLIQNSIFGVDIQSIACQIAKLRFFISLTIEQEPDRNADNVGIKPLPNLETRFVAANTLIGLKRERILISPRAQTLEHELGENRERHFHATTRSQKLACKRKDKELRQELATELRNIGMPADDADKVAAWDPYDQNASTDWFDAEWMFGLAAGFDVVIGNPPYIQLQSEGGRLANLYEPCNFDTFTRTGDIYCLFYEKASQLSKNGGHVCFITSNKWMRAGYGKKLRNYFILHTQPIQLIDMGEDVFDATVNTNILLLQNTAPNVGLTFTAATIRSDFDTHTGDIAQYLRDNGVAMELPLQGEPWTILSPIERALKRKIEEVGTPLKDWDINIYRGIITGCNEAFVVDRETRDRLIAEHPSSAEVLKPFLRGRDVKRWQINFAEQYLIKIESSENREHPWSGQSAGEAEQIFADTYPAIHAHLEIYRELLIDRHDQGNYFWELRSCAYWEEFEQTQIVWGNLAQSPQFAFADAGFYLSAPATMMVSDSKYLLGILNSRITRYLVSQSAAERQGGFLEFKPMYIAPLPIPDPPENEGISALVSQILDAKDTNPDANVSELEDEIDQMVYLLYDLDDDEIDIVEAAETISITD